MDSAIHFYNNWDQDATTEICSGKRLYSCRTILPKIWAKPRPENEKGLLLVNVRRPRTSPYCLHFINTRKNLRAYARYNYATVEIHIKRRTFALNTWTICCETGVTHTIPPHTACVLLVGFVIFNHFLLMLTFSWLDLTLYKLWASELAVLC